MAEGLLRARLASVAPEVAIGSMGLLFDGRRAEPNAVKALKGDGIDLSRHASQTLALEGLAPASLILGMERAHVRAVAELSDDLFARSFTLPEFVRSAAVFGPRPVGEALVRWVERIGSVRAREAYQHDDPLTAIADPMGGSRKAFRACAEEIAEHLDELVALAWPDPDPRGSAVAPATTGGIP
jgi:protein-tyrosine phosphatase